MSAPASYIASPIKRKRRSKADMEAIRTAIYEVLAELNPQTVRQVFYQLVGRGVVGKTEGEYDGTVVRLLTEMRRDGTIPFDWIGDNTRWMRKPTTYGSLHTMLELSKQTYRRALWNDQKDYVEIWLEKDALSGVVLEETVPYDVPLMVTRGYPSVTFLHSAGEEIAQAGKPSYIYYFGDHDPSGRDITRTVKEGLQEFGGDAEMYFQRVAVTEFQIRLHRLPTRPTKKSDSRSKKFEGESVEVDALPVTELRSLVRHCIEKHIDKAALAATKRTEELERETLQRMIANMRQGDSQ